MGVIETFSAVQSIPQEQNQSRLDESQQPVKRFVVQIGAFNNDRGAKLLRDKNLERFGDKHIEIHEFPGEHGPFRVWLHDFKSYKAARKYIEHHAIDGFIIELKAGEHIRTKL
jgi:hypothetical protein